MSVPEIDGDQLLNNDMLVIYVQVGTYTCILAFGGIIQKLIEIVKRDRLHRVIRRHVVQSLNQQVDLTDVFVRCSCPDSAYRFRYWQNFHNYGWGEPENRPAKITNPNDRLGATCKHLSAILANKRWLVKASSVVNDYIHDHYDEFVEKYQINPEEFIIHEQQHQAAITGAVKRDIKRLPAPLLGVVNKLYVPEELDDELFKQLNPRGFEIRVDHDMDKPVAVYISKSLSALDNPQDSVDNVFIFDVKPAGTKIRLVRIDDKPELSGEV